MSLMVSENGSDCGAVRLNYVFGPNWSEQDVKFEASDDRVRGGTSEVFYTSFGRGPKSQSHLTIQSGGFSGECALFHGTLDTKTLGGAGFASQRTADTSKVWDCSDTDAVLLYIARGDGTYLIPV